jgi:N-acetylmuramoyl-L-alanine amidase
MIAKALHDYVKSQRAADRPASWHYSIDEKECYQALPLTESGWHAGDNLGPGNTATIGIEICDYGMRRDNNWNLFWQAVDNCARLCAHIINNVDTLLPYPECLVPYEGTLKQHYNWSGKNCPALIRAGGGAGSHWQRFVDLVGTYLKTPEVIEPEQPKPSTVYRVLVGSFEEYDNAAAKANQVKRLGPSVLGLIVYNQVGTRKLYRVVAAEHEAEDLAQTVKTWLEGRGEKPFIVAGIFEDLPLPEPDELIDGYDPDIDREWIDDHPEEFEDGKDPYQDVTGLMVLLRQLYEILKKLFGGD